MAYTYASLVRSTVNKLSQSITDAEIEVFCEKATVYLDARLGGVYGVPFNPVPPIIQSLATDLAGYYIAEWLYTSQRPNVDEKTVDKFNRIKETIELILNGDISIGVEPQKASGFATTNDGRDPIFDYDTEW